MATKALLKLKPRNTLAVAFLALAGANYLAGRYGGYPFLYCWTAPVLRELYLAWGMVALYLIIVYILIALWRKNVIGVMGSAMLFIAFLELPRLSYHLFGGECGQG